MSDESTPMPSSVELNAPAAPAAAPSDAPLTYVEAVAAKKAMLEKVGFADRWLNGEMTARNEMQRITSALAGGPPDSGRLEREMAVSKSLLSPYQRAEYTNLEPVSQEIHDQGVQMLADLKRDVEF